MLAAVMMLAQAAGASGAALPAERCDAPVIMIVSGPTHDRARMLAYGKAIADSGLYQKLGGYYVNLAFPQAIFEGDAPKGYVNLIVRFPCMANARAFWFSKEYQEKIKPLRLNPSAGDYIVTVYPEAPLRDDMKGKVGDNAYRTSFDRAGIAQVEGARP